MLRFGVIMSTLSDLGFYMYKYVCVSTSHLEAFSFRGFYTGYTQKWENFYITMLISFKPSSALQHVICVAKFSSILQS